MVIFYTPQDRKIEVNAERFEKKAENSDRPIDTLQNELYNFAPFCSCYKFSVQNNTKYIKFTRNTTPILIL